MSHEDYQGLIHAYEGVSVHAPACRYVRSKRLKEWMSENKYSGFLKSCRLLA